MAEVPTGSSSAAPNVGRAGGIMMASIFLSRVLGIGREMILGWKFGQNEITDAYRTAFQIPDLLFYLISAGALSQAFIPIFSEYLHTGREKEAWKVFSAVVSLMGVFVIAFIAFAWVAAEPLAHYLAPGRSAELVSLIAYMSRILVFTQFAFLIGGLLMGTLYARQIFTIPGLGPNIYNLGIIFGALVISSFCTVPIVGMTWGALAGAFLGSLILPLFVIRKMGMEYKFTLDTSHPGTRKVFKLMAPIIFGLSLPSVFPIITRYFGNYYGSGVVSSLENMNQLMQAPLGVFGQSLAIAVLPALSQFFATGDMAKYRHQLASSLRQIIFLSAPFCAMFVLFSHDIVKAIFEHGKFGPDATARTAAALTMAGVGIIGWCMQPVLMRGYFSVHKTLPPVIMGTICTFIYVGGCYACVRFGFGQESMPLLGSFLAMAMAVAMTFGLCKEVGKIDLVAMSVTLIKSVVAAFGAGLVLVASHQVMPDAASGVGRFGQVAMVGFVLVVFAWAYYFLCRKMRMPEVEYLDRAISKLDRKKKATD
ncbi:MAG: murein biosynthesis integral membrane protein MurJ [Armatimonadetes bacterium]|nr:murein biosynthesis integral membrane protein MurJ [Armatimonadota bacterium]